MIRMLIACVLAMWCYRYHTVNIDLFYNPSTRYDTGLTASEMYRQRDIRLERIKNGSVPIWPRSAIIARKHALDFFSVLGGAVTGLKADGLLVGRLVFSAGTLVTWGILNFALNTRKSGAVPRMIVALLPCAAYFTMIDVVISDLFSVGLLSVFGVTLSLTMSAGLGALYYTLSRP